jgi:hypothetical protein
MMSIENPDERVRSREVWKRGLFMLLFAVAFGISQVVLNAVAIVQVLWLLFTGAPNQFLARFGRSFSSWLAETAQFMTCASDDKPFPWRQWPDAG